MKKKVIILSAVGVLVFLAAWSVLTPKSIFPNRGLESIIREQIGKLEGEITPEDCLGITELEIVVRYFSYADFSNFSSLEGLQYFTDLEVLTVCTGSVSDISALSELHNLKKLDLDKNRIKDLSPLSGLTNLEELRLYNNRVKDLSPLASLSNLKNLVIGKNPVERLENGFAPLAHLEGLGIGSYADYDLVAKDGTFVDRNTLPREEVVIDNPPEQIK